MEALLLKLDITKYKQEFIQLIQKSQSPDLIKILINSEKEMEKQMEQFRTKIQSTEQKVKDMTDPCYNFYKTRGDTDIYEKLNRQNSWDIPGFPEKERDFGANIYHHFFQSS